jgi:Skp family chaperone for outer membrane proteins
MKKTTALMIVCSLSAAPLIFADESIVTINSQEIMMKSETGQALQAKLRAKQEELTKDIRKEGEKIQKEEQRLIEKSKSDKADASELEFEKRQLGLSFQKLQAEGQKIEAKLSEVYQEEVQKFQKICGDVLKDLGKENKWKIVQLEEQIPYFDPSISRTSMVIQAVDEKTKKENQAKKQALENKSKSQTAENKSKSDNK